MKKSQQIQEEIVATLKKEMPLGTGEVFMAEHTRLSLLKLFERLDEIEKQIEDKKSIEDQVYDAIVSAFQFDENGYLKVSS